MREEKEWVDVAVPDLRIVDPRTANAVEQELARRSTGQGRGGNGNRVKYLLSGRIKCGVCGSSFTLAGKDYYRCAGQRERGVCSNTISVRKNSIENAVLSALQTELLTADMAKLFAEEFAKEVARRTRGEDEGTARAKERLVELDRELKSLSQNLLAGVVGPTITNMISEREEEKARIIRDMSAAEKPRATPVLAHPVLLRHFEEKVKDLRAARTPPVRAALSGSGNAVT